MRDERRRARARRGAGRACRVEQLLVEGVELILDPLAILRLGLLPEAPRGGRPRTRPGSRSTRSPRSAGRSTAGCRREVHRAAQALAQLQMRRAPSSGQRRRRPPPGAPRRGREPPPAPQPPPGRSRRGRRSGRRAATSEVPRDARAGRRLRRLGVLRAARDAEEVEVDTPYGRRPTDRCRRGRRAPRRVPAPARPPPRPAAAPHPVPRQRLGAARARRARVLGPCAAGSLDRDVPPGTFVVCDQFVDRTQRAAPTPSTTARTSTHVSAADPYCPSLRARARRRRAAARARRPRRRHDGRRSRGRASRPAPSRRGSPRWAGR